MQKLTFSISTDEITELQIYTNANDTLQLLKETAEVLGLLSRAACTQYPDDVYAVTDNLYNKIMDALEHAGQV